MPADESTAERFSLTKWYLDCADADGRVAIGYWASVCWRGLAVNWHSVAVHEPGLAPRVHSSVRQVAAPAQSGREITWQSPALHCAFVVDACTSSPPLRLLDGPDGHVDWQCVAPAAHTMVVTDHCAPIRGVGYAECMAITMLPWKLPIDELRWGRWAAGDAAHSVVWIDWQGAAPNRWVLVNGTLCDASSVSDDEVAVDGGVLTLAQPRTLHKRLLGEIVASVPPLPALLPPSMLSLREHKWCSEGTWRAGSGTPETGWAIHEVVRFR